MEASVKRYYVHTKSGTIEVIWARSSEAARYAGEQLGHRVVSVELAP